MTKAVRLEFDGPVAIITNDNIEKPTHSTTNWTAAVRRARGAQGAARRPGRIWRGEGKSFSSGATSRHRRSGVELSHHDSWRAVTVHPAGVRLERRSWWDARLVDRRVFQRALFVDIRVAPRARASLLPEVPTA